MLLNLIVVLKNVLYNNTLKYIFCIFAGYLTFFDSNKLGAEYFSFYFFSLNERLVGLLLLAKHWSSFTNKSQHFCREKSSNDFFFFLVSRKTDKFDKFALNIFL